MVKVLDGRPVNGRFWVFFGGLSDVEYDVRVRDTVAHASRTYHSGPGDLCGRADTDAFAAASRTGPAVAGADLSGATLGASSRVDLGEPLAAGGGGVCAPAAGVLCLQGGRFAVTVDWMNQHAGGVSGVGSVRPAPVGGEKTGFFWFFNQDNVELVVKLIDGRSVNGKFWFFSGGLSDVEYDVHVHDTLTGTTRTYHNEPGSLCGQADTTAF